MAEVPVLVGAAHVTVRLVSVGLPTLGCAGAPGRPPSSSVTATVAVLPGDAAMVYPVPAVSVAVIEPLGSSTASLVVVMVYVYEPPALMSLVFCPCDTEKP